jgi:putative ABC transport system permease protein
MFPVFRSLSLRYLRLRSGRALLVVASIALGVATLVSTRILNQVLEHAAHDTMTPIPTADLYVTNSEIGVQRELAAEIRAARIPGVEVVVPMIFEQVTLPEIGGPNGKIAILVAADMDALNSVKDDGKQPFKPHVLDWTAARRGTGIFISQFLQQERQAKGIREHAPVKVTYADKEVEYVLAGTLEVDREGAAASFERNLVAMDLDLALKLLKHQHPPVAAHLAGSTIPALDAVKGDRVSRIDIHIAKDADKARIQSAVQQVVGDQAAVKTL